MGGRTRGGFRRPGFVRAVVALAVIVAVSGCYRAIKDGGEVAAAPGTLRDSGAAGAESPGAAAGGTAGAAGPAPLSQAGPDAGRTAAVGRGEGAPAGRAPDAAEGSPGNAPQEAAPGKGPAAPGPEGLEKRGVPAPEAAGTRSRADRPRTGASRPNGHPSSGDAKAETPAAREVEEPVWAKSREDLVYRIRFLGVTAGFARFSYAGREIVEGKETHHIRVRAWTTSVLALVYPVDDTVDYYVDVRTLAPVRQDFQKRERNTVRDEITIFDPMKGTITTRLKGTGEIRKRVDAPPGVQDPVTMVYNFRAQDDWREDRFCDVYAGRKLWQISARKVGTETLRTGRGAVETVLLQPVIRQNGKVQDKGDLRIWMTNDRWRVPVRIFAKIKFGTLVGDLDLGEGRVAHAGQ